MLYTLVRRKSCFEKAVRKQLTVSLRVKEAHSGARTETSAALAQMATIKRYAVGALIPSVGALIPSVGALIPSARPRLRTVGALIPGARPRLRTNEQN